MKLAEATFAGDVDGAVRCVALRDIGSPFRGRAPGRLVRSRWRAGVRGAGGRRPGQSVEGDGGEPEARDELADGPVVAVPDRVGAGRAERGVPGDPGAH